MALASTAGTLLLRFARERRAMGAVEFAMVAPFLLLLYLGGSQASMALTVNRKVQHAASMIDDLVTQSDKLDGNDIKGIYNIANAMITPYDLTPLGIKVTSVGIDDKGLQTVDWDCPTSNMPTSPKGSAFALPSEFAGLRDRHVVVAQTIYTYKPVAGYFITGSIKMGGTSYLNPRNGTTVESPGC